MQGLLLHHLAGEVLGAFRGKCRRRPRPMNDHPQHILPSSPFGITSTRYVQVDNPLIPLPRRNLMLAANALNDYLIEKLTHQQRGFVDVYLSSGFNAGEAAKRAGFCDRLDRSDEKLFERECAAIGRRLVKKPYIARALDLAMAFFSESSRIDTRRLINELSNIAYSSMADYWENDGTGEPRLRMPEDHESGKLAAVQHIKMKTSTRTDTKGNSITETETEFKLHSKIQAIDKLLDIAKAQGDPEVVGLEPQKEQGGGNVTNIFNIVPVESGNFIGTSAPPSAMISMTQQPPLITYGAGEHARPQLEASTPGTIAPSAAPDWGRPEKVQKRQLTIDNIP